MEEKPRYVGIDVSKAQVDVAVRPTGQRWSASYDETGVVELVSRMVDLGPALNPGQSRLIRGGLGLGFVHSSCVSQGIDQPVVQIGWEFVNVRFGGRH